MTACRSLGGLRPGEIRRMSIWWASIAGSAGSKSAVADFDILKCQSRASPTLVPPDLVFYTGNKQRTATKGGRDARGPGRLIVIRRRTAIKIGAVLFSAAASFSCH